MSIPIEQDVEANGLARIISQWKDSPNFQGLVKSYLTSLAEIEPALFDLLEQRNLDTAVGAQLDVIGTIVGITRGELDDTDYRQAIRNEVASNTSSGTGEEILQAIITLTGTDNPNIFEHGIASLYYLTDQNATTEIAVALDKSTGAGISGRLILDGDDVVVPAEVSVEENILADDTNDEFEVFDGAVTDFLGVQSTTAVASPKSILAEVGEITPYPAELYLS